VYNLSIQPNPPRRLRRKENIMSNEQKDPKSDKPATQSIGFWIAIGAGIGAGLGVAMDNIAVGVAIGVAIGAGIGAAQNAGNKTK
jgi:hypothetical protein